MTSWRAIREESLSSPLHEDPSRHLQQRNAALDPADMEKLVHQRCGTSPTAQWFHRDKSGEGEGLSFRTPTKWARRRLSPKRFPKFLIDHHWRDGEAMELIDNYVAWTAPYLLALHHFSERTRERLERNAARNALAVADNWRLYPRVVNQEAITAARVEARMRRAV